MICHLGIKKGPEALFLLDKYRFRGYTLEKSDSRGDIA